MEYGHGVEMTCDICDYLDARFDPDCGCFFAGVARTQAFEIVFDGGVVEGFVPCEDGAVRSQLCSDKILEWSGCRPDG